LYPLHFQETSLSYQVHGCSTVCLSYCMLIAAHALPIYNLNSYLLWGIDVLYELTPSQKLQLTSLRAKQSLLRK